MSEVAPTRHERSLLHVTFGMNFSMATTQVSVRVRKHRSALRKAGLRPVRIRVPDTRQRGSAAKRHRQCQLVSQADVADTLLEQLASESVANVEGGAE